VECARSATINRSGDHARGDSTRLAASLGRQDLIAGVRLLVQLPGLLRRRPTASDARRILRERLVTREARFLAFVGRGVFEQPGSPYASLFGRAGCERGDLERLVQRDGVEGALLALFRAGIHLSEDEFKGRRPVRRGADTLAVSPERLVNPTATFDLVTQSGGSRGTRTTVPTDLAWVRERAVGTFLAVLARGGTRWRHALWNVPGGSALSVLLQYAHCDLPLGPWFSQVDPAAPGLHPRYRWSARAVRWASVLAGAPLPSAQHVSVADPLPIARWAAALLQAGQTPHLDTFPSAAVRLCRTALREGIDVAGLKLRLTGEPVTEARLRVVREAGAEPFPLYAVTGSGPVGQGCLAPAHPDEVHLLHDLHAFVQPGLAGATSLPRSRALLVSTFSAAAPFVLINVALGDEAVLTDRRCGCPFEALGWTGHAHTIRSYEKLTAAGMTFADVDVARVLDEILPARFGGTPTDYQLVEDASGDGEPRLRLVVAPAVRVPDVTAVAEAFLAGIGQGSGAERIMSDVWRRSGVLRVEVREPLAGPSGKIWHVHLNPRAGAGSEPAGRA
jgi:hypothetical protein